MTLRYENINPESEELMTKILKKSQFQFVTRNIKSITISKQILKSGVKYVRISVHFRKEPNSTTIYYISYLAEAIQRVFGRKPEIETFSEGHVEGHKEPFRILVFGLKY